MLKFSWKLATIVLLTLVISIAGFGLAVAKGGKPGGETAGNNLSFPVIWAEGVAKTLPGTPGMTPITNGEWWYQWGTNGIDPNITPASCPPDPDESNVILNPTGLPYCDDGLTNSLTLIAGEPAADDPLPLAKAFIQKDPNNSWQAGSADWSASPVNVHWIDWGDSLESVDWYTRSMVRTEVVLFQDLVEPMLEYQMRHTLGWGIDEVHGMAASLEDHTPLLGPGNQATVYSPCARLTIQLLLTDRDDPLLPNLIWVPTIGWVEESLFDSTSRYSEGDVVWSEDIYWKAIQDIPFTSEAPTESEFWSEVEECVGDTFDAGIFYSAGSCIIYTVGTEETLYEALVDIPTVTDSPEDGDNWTIYNETVLINPPIFNGAVHEGGDGPGYYSAEINVKGRIIYGYTWNVRQLHDDTLNQYGAGDYRITFSFDEECGGVDLNTFFVDGVTEILYPAEEEMTAAALAEESESTEGGAVAEKDFDNNLTYMDVRILERGGGGGGGGKPEGKRR